MARNLSNFLIFQAVWVACVLGAASGHPWLGAGVGLLLLPANLAFVPVASNRKHERSPSQRDVCLFLPDEFFVYDKQAEFEQTMESDWY